MALKIKRATPTAKFKGSCFKHLEIICLEVFAYEI